MQLFVKKFTFNPFQENTYIVYGQDKSAVIIDPGCSTSFERNEFVNFIDDNKLNVKALLNTHCHIDHVFGNAFVIEKYNVDFYMHPLDIPLLALAERSAQVYGIDGFVPSPQPTQLIEDGQILKFGDIQLNVIFGPGHAPGHVMFYSLENEFVISGDIVIQGAFGRVDLPGGDIEVLKNTIFNRLFTLPDETIIFSGHGGESTVGIEKVSNMILKV